MKWRYWIQHVTGQISESPLYHKVSVTIIIILILTGVFNSLLCNEKPLVAKTKNDHWEFPAFVDFKNDMFPWHRSEYIQKQEYSYALYPPVRYSYHTLGASDLGAKRPGYSQGKANIWYTNWLGTDELGRDVLAGITRGLYHSVRISILATFFSVLIGSILGMLLGYMGDHKLKLNSVQIAVRFIAFLLFLFYIVFGEYFWALCVLLTGVFLYHQASKLRMKRYAIPIESLGVGIITLRKSIPTLILLFGLLPLFQKPGASNLIIILSLIGWTSIAWIIRIHTKEIATKDYIFSAQSLGIDNMSIIFRHIYPNLRNTILLLFIFQLGAMITVEAALSYLGVGIAPDEVSLGSMLKQSKANVQHWWLAVFPGSILTLTLLCLHLIYEYQQNKVFEN